MTETLLHILQNNFLHESFALKCNKNHKNLRCFNRPYSEYFSRGVANRTPSPFQACDGVQLQINIKNMSTGVLLDHFY